MRFILHIGQTKAGSTAIQNYLELQREALVQHGFLFPKAGFLRANRFALDRTAGHLDLVRSIATGATDEFEAELCGAGAQTLVLSAENLFLDRPDAEFTALARYFERFEIIVVLVVRDIADWLVSRYVEDVVSGFRTSVQTFSEFVAEKSDQGALDHAKRLEHVARQLNARSVRVISYEAALAGGGLVPAFLDAAGLPHTDPGLARGIRANVREKPWFLVEGARRLNHLMRGFPREARLELEATIRDHGRRIAQAARETPSFDAAPPLSGGACAEIAASNRRLAGTYGLTPPLASPRPGRPDRYQHRKRIDGADAIVAFGLKAAARISRSRPLANRTHGAGLHLEGSEAMVDLLAKATVSLHLDSPETALMAACLEGRLPILVDDGTVPHSSVDKLQALKLPSEILCLGNDSQRPGTARFLRGGNKRAIDLVVAARPARPETLAAWWRDAGPDAHLCLVAADRPAVAEIAARLDLAPCLSSADISVLSRPNRPTLRGTP